MCGLINACSVLISSHQVAASRSVAKRAHGDELHGSLYVAYICRVHVGATAPFDAWPKASGRALDADGSRRREAGVVLTALYFPQLDLM